MEPFEYLSVMNSVVLGLGISHLLADAARLIQGRAQVRFYWVTLVWAFILLLQHLQMWWILFDYRDLGQWSFFTFLLTLLPSMLLYTSTALVLPEFNVGEGIDLRAHYYKIHRWFFPLVTAAVLLISVRVTLVRGFPVLYSGNYIRVPAMAFFIVAALVRAPRYHALVAVVALALYLLNLYLFTSALS